MGTKAAAASFLSSGIACRGAEFWPSTISFAPEGGLIANHGRPELRAALVNGVATRSEVTLSDSREHRRDDAVAPRLMERERG